MNKWSLICALGFSMSLFACVPKHLGVRNAKRPTPNLRIAVMPFHGDSDSLGEGLSGALTTELLCDGFTVMERSEMIQLLMERQRSSNPAFQALATLSRVQGVDAILVGSLTTHLHVRHDGWNVTRETLEVDTVTVKWVDVKSGKILAGATLTNPRGNDLSSLAKRLARSIKNDVEKAMLPGRLQQADANHVQKDSRLE